MHGNTTAIRIGPTPAIDVVTSYGRKQSCEIAALGPAEVKAAINQWLDDVAASAPL